MKIVETKTYNTFTNMDEAKLLNIAIIELEEVLKLFESVNTLSFYENLCGGYTEVKENEVRKIRDLLEALMANEIEVTMIAE